MSGIAWRGGAELATRLLRIAVFLLLARLLTPEIFGLVALASVFITVLEHVASGGVSQAIIHLPNLTRRHLDAAFVLSVSSGVIVGGVVLLGATPLAAWFEEPMLGPVLMSLSVVPLLSGFTMVPEGLLSRGLQFRALSIRHLVSAVTSITVAVVLALLGAGVWALVAQTVVEAVVSAVILWAVTLREYRPGLRFDGSSASEIVTYGSKVLGFDLTTVASTRTDDLLVGSFLGPLQLGLYSVGYKLLMVVRDSIHTVALAVAFPIFSRLQDDPERAAHGLLRSSSLTLAICGPLLAFVAAASAAVVPFLLGDQWVAAVPIVSVLAIAGIAGIVTDVNNAFLQAQSSAGQVLAFAVASAVLNVTGFAIAVQHGILWVAVAFAVRSFVTLPVSYLMVHRKVGGGGRLAAAHVRVMAATGAAVAPCFAIGWLRSTGGSDFLVLLLTASAGLAIYLVVLRLVAQETFNDMSGFVGHLVRRATAREREEPEH
ncbi:lipopolysaccharide biosynthesis protein [Pseudonocardia alni]|uniref:lipopolysaccharide biosynthesis protein n=1 Tax=Pseudonocardia alni TaxID=33907 RepID=UPI0027A0E8E8|nr:lipopolysaccharide biosynthesis protein [Pseudonocardia alni]